MNIQINMQDFSSLGRCLLFSALWSMGARRALLRHGKTPGFSVPLCQKDLCYGFIIFIGHTQASLCLYLHSGGKDSYASGPSTVLSIRFSNKIFCALCSAGMWGPSSLSSDSFPLPHCVESPVSCSLYILSCFISSFNGVYFLAVF